VTLAGRLVALLAGVGYGAATWYRYGRIRPTGRDDELLDRFMPAYEARLRNSPRWTSRTT
jgi:hypothetical protein